MDGEDQGLAAGTVYYNILCVGSRYGDVFACRLSQTDCFVSKPHVFNRDQLVCAVRFCYRKIRAIWFNQVLGCWTRICGCVNATCHAN